MDVCFGYWKNSQDIQCKPHRQRQGNKHDGDGNCSRIRGSDQVNAGRGETGQTHLSVLAFRVPKL